MHNNTAQQTPKERGELKVSHDLLKFKWKSERQFPFFIENALKNSWEAVAKNVYFGSPDLM